MKSTALSQVLEQIFRVIFGLGTAYLMMRGILGTGPLASYSTPEKEAAGDTFETTIGALAG